MECLLNIFCCRYIQTKKLKTDRTLQSTNCIINSTNRTINSINGTTDITNTINFDDYNHNNHNNHNNHINHNNDEQIICPYPVTFHNTTENFNSNNTVNIVDLMDINRTTCVSSQIGQDIVHTDESFSINNTN
jgi:hypothetical protein